METSNVFNTPPPEFNQEEVLDILLKYYNIDCSIENLVSDRDQNFKIISKEQIYILKIANSAESKRVLEMQNLAMNYISNKDSWEECLQIANFDNSSCNQLFHYTLFS